VINVATANIFFLRTDFPAQSDRILDEILEYLFFLHENAPKKENPTKSCKGITVIH